MISILPRLIYLLYKIIFDKDELQKYREDNKIQTSSCLNKNLWILQTASDLYTKHKWNIYDGEKRLMIMSHWPLTFSKSLLLEIVQLFSILRFLLQSWHCHKIYWMYPYNKPPRTTIPRKSRYFEFWKCLLTVGITVPDAKLANAPEVRNCSTSIISLILISKLLLSF